MSKGNRAAVPSEPDDFSDVKPKVADAAIQRIRELALEMRSKEAAVKAAEAGVKTAKKDLADIRDGALSDAIDRLGVGGVDVPDLGFVGVKNDVVGSLPSADEKPEERAAALAWFERNDPGLIKRLLTAQMPRDMEDIVTPAQILKVVQLLLSLADRQPGVEGAMTLNDVVEQVIAILVPGTVVDTKLDIHYQTLMAWGREQVESGRGVDLRPLGLVPVRRATITKPRTTNRRNAKEL
jgi:hypothetical protein